MPVKELIERFHARFKGIRLRLTWVVERNDMIDDYDPRACNTTEQDADIDTIMGEFLDLPWYPGREFIDHDVDPDNEEAFATACKVKEQNVLDALTQFDPYYEAIQRNEAEDKPMPFEEGCAHSRKFREDARTRWPLLYCEYPTKGRWTIVDWAYGLGNFCKRAEKVLAEPNKKKQLELLCNMIGSCGEWGDSPGPVQIETIKQNLQRHRTEDRERLEPIAQALADKYKVKVYSIKFLHACHRELACHRDRREGLREDGLCATGQYPGTIAAVDEWFELNDGINDDMSRIYDLMDWFKDRCPLLWANYLEWRRRKKKEGTAT